MPGRALQPQREQMLDRGSTAVLFEKLVETARTDSRVAGDLLHAQRRSEVLFDLFQCPPQGGVAEFLRLPADFQFP